jgi:hypothetical protein
MLELLLPPCCCTAVSQPSFFNRLALSFKITHLVVVTDSQTDIDILALTGLHEEP